MDIREVTADDVETLQRNCFSINSVEQTRVQIEQAMERSARGEGASFVALQDGEVVANVTVSRNGHRLQRHRAHLGGFVIHPKAQGQGLARELTTVCARFCELHDCTILELDCRSGTHAEDAYRGLGFQEWGRMPAGFVEDAGTFDQVCFFLVIKDWLQGNSRKATFDNS